MNIRNSLGKFYFIIKLFEAEIAYKYSLLFVLSCLFVCLSFMPFNHCRLFNAKSICIQINWFFFQAIQFSQTVLIQTIQFSMNSNFFTHP